MDWIYLGIKKMELKKLYSWLKWPFKKLIASTLEIHNSIIFNQLYFQIKNLKIKWLPNYLRKKIHKKINHIPNLCSWPKSSRKKTNVMFLNFFLNAMIKNIKIHDSLYYWDFKIYGT